MNETNRLTRSSAPTLNVAFGALNSDDAAQIPGPREYRIQDFWGDDPTVFAQSERMETKTLPTQHVLSIPEPETERSLMQRLLTWLADPIFIEPIASSEQMARKASATHASS